ncbi:hypothetical protein CLCR_09352 [Cladophialophora carrionii]|uniref:Uncharacterized protein n=1 Tax=Cladophialophora carrionii TaxID=86049 RepID=A0A1C1CRG5_9EURO|nr:hypothetical protein CLCR_09352 [Cladophialophora carrionii]
MSEQQHPLPKLKEKRASSTISNDSPAASLPEAHIHIPSLAKVMRESKKDVHWNTADLGMRLGADFISAASAAVLVAPIITVIDR